MIKTASGTMAAGSKEQLSIREGRIYQFLKQNPVGVLCSITPDNSPHGSVIYFDVGLDFQIYFITRSRTTKHENLIFHSQVSLVVFDPVSQSVVQVAGAATEITDRYRVNGIASQILTISQQAGAQGMPPVTKLHAGPYVAFTIHPSQIRWATYTNPETAADTSTFKSFESFELNLP